LIFAALGLAGFAFGEDYWQDRQRPGSTAVQVDGTKFTLRYFSDRLRMHGQQVGIPASSAEFLQAINTVTGQLVEETILIRFASEMDVSASEAEIKDEMAIRLGTTADDPGFDLRFQAELSRSGLSEEQYTQMIEAAVLRDKIQEKLEAEVPASAESIHYRLILVNDQATADDILRRVEEGEDFAELAVELSLDTATAADGGDVGWVPRGGVPRGFLGFPGVLPPDLEDTFFAMEPGEVTTFPTSIGVFFLQMEEKAEDREIEPDQRSVLAEGALLDWLTEKRTQLEIREFVIQDGDKASWAFDHAYLAS
jgi:foldase protein PrsA